MKQTCPLFNSGPHLRQESTPNVTALPQFARKMLPMSSGENTRASEFERFTQKSQRQDIPLVFRSPRLLSATGRLVAHEKISRLEANGCNQTHKPSQRLSHFHPSMSCHPSRSCLFTKNGAQSCGRYAMKHGVNQVCLTRYDSYL
uniref:Uncharacterized protein n=1 Tax=Entomoneis paludosa TaxID=265537 RepID=A0A7S2Y585_9STRA